MERTLILIKPDSVQRGLCGEIIGRFEKKGLKIVGMKMMKLREAVLREHYAHVAGEPFFLELSKFMSSSPVVAIVIEGPGAVKITRKIAGTSPDELGSIRGDLSISSQRNVVHSSDSIETANREIRRFFADDELFEYDKDEWRHVFSESEMKK